AAVPAGRQARLLAVGAVRLEDREALAGVADLGRNAGGVGPDAALALADGAVPLGLLVPVARLADRAVLAALEAVAPRLAGADRAVDDARLAAARAAGVLEHAHAEALLALDERAAGRAGLLRPRQAVAVRAGDVDLLLPLAEGARHLAVLAGAAVDGGLIAVGERLEV